MAYLDTILADAPTHYWRCADPGGVVVNDIGSARPLPLIGIGASAAGSLGYSGPNANGGSVIMTALPYFGSVGKLQAVLPVSIDWIIWCPGPRADGVQTFSFGWADNGNGPFHNITADGLYRLNFGAGTSVPAAAITPNRWHHFAFTYAALAGDFNYYIDGALQPHTTASGVIGAWNDQWLIGRGVGHATGYIGAGAEFAIYNSILSGAQVTAHFNAIDQQLSPPVFTQAGRFDIPGGGVTPLQQNIDDIRNAVIHIYGNAP